MEYLVSIIIPVYNVEKYLHRCLDSVVSQTYTNLEIIIVNDGSPDGSQAIIDQYAARDARIRTRMQENRTIGMARNAGLDMARGEYLAFVDSDDYLEPEAIAVMMDNALSTGADIVAANNRILDAEVRCSSSIGDGILALEETRASAWRFGYFIAPAYGITVWGKLYRHDFIKATGVRFESSHRISGEDILFNLLLFTHDPKLSLLNQYVYVYRMNEGSITHSYRPRLAQRYLTLLVIYRQQLVQLGKLEEFRDLMAFLVLRFISTCCHNEYLYSPHRYAAIKGQLAELMSSDIVQSALQEVAGGNHINAITARNQTYTRLQASLLRHGMIGTVARLRILRLNFM